MGLLVTYCDYYDYSDLPSHFACGGLLYAKSSRVLSTSEEVLIRRKARKRRASIALLLQMSTFSE